MSDDEQMLADTQTRASIAALLNKEGGQTLTEICTALSLSVDGTRPLINAMVEDGLLFMDKAGTRKEYYTKPRTTAKPPRRKSPKVHHSTGEVELVIGGGMIVVPSDRMVIVTTNPATGRTQIVIEERS